MHACSNCGRPNAEDARFCSACGTALAPEARREERKVVSVLFADLVGFTSRAEQLDPEDVRALLSPYHARLRAELERYGGTVEKFIGDAVMALFGAPVVHEDDSERAVRAALAIRDWAREAEGELQLRIAVATGEALIALGARPGEGEGMASGDVVNTAARLQTAAPVNGILVDQTTYRATRHAIEYRDAEAVTAKGKAEPVPAWEAIEARARFGVDTGEPPSAPLIGRERELDTLVGALARVREDRSPQLVTLIGVPGIGKSRLVYELFQAVEADPELINWRQGRSLPYGEGVSFWALGEMVKAQAGILETDSAGETERKLRLAIGTTIEDTRDAAWVESHVGPLVGLAAEAEGLTDQRAESFAAWRRLFEALAEDRPLVLVFEDLHWADEGLLDFVDHLIDWAVGVPILVVCTARPELLSRRSGWGGGKPNAATLSLSPLSDTQTAQLLAALLERAVLPAETQTALLQRAGGNPLYAEEFVRMVADRGVPTAEGELPVPESVQGIVAARLDALSAEEKGLLQDAAVVGKVFWLGAAAEISGAERGAAERLLHGLERREFVRRERRSSVADEIEYAFRHLLVRDVAYAQIPRAGRSAKHERAARWVEALGRPEDHAEMVAHHYLTAIELARAAGSDVSGLAGPARLAFADAGRRARALNSFTAARPFYAAAVEHWPADHPERPRLLLEYGHVLTWVEGDPFEILDEALAGLLEAGDLEGAAEAETRLSEFSWRRGQQDETFEHIRRAQRLIADRPPSATQVHVVANHSRYLTLAGQLDDAIRMGRAALAQANELGLEELRAHALNSIGVARVSGGDTGGLDDLQQSLVISLDINSVESVRSYGNLGSTLATFGELDRAFAMQAEGRKMAERFGVNDWLRWLRGEEAIEWFTRGLWDDARARVDELIAGSEERQFFMEPALRGIRARIGLAEGRVDRALEDVELAVDFGRHAKDPQTLLPALASAARVFAAAGQTGRGLELADELLELGRPSGWEIPGEWLEDLAIAVVDLDRREEFGRSAARTPLRTRWLEAASSYVSGDFGGAAEIFAEMGTLPSEAYARLRAAEADLARGRQAEADAQLGPALAFWRSVGARAYVTDGERLLAASA